jgi:hypothetical protein
MATSALTAVLVGGVAGASTPKNTGGTHGGPRSSTPTVSLVWSQFPNLDGSDPAAYYVARITNPTKTRVAEELNTYVLDASGTIIGSSQDALPLIRAHSQFDYFGRIGGGVLGEELTGTPASLKIQVSKGSVVGSGEPMLPTSELQLTQGGPDDFTNAPGTYDLTVKVTNSTSQTISSGVIQQTVLYDQAGNVVGGGTAFSDNVPDSLPPGMSYRESWGGIASWGTAARAGYTVWPEG